MPVTTPLIGILGGGQLGQMLFQAAIGMGFYPRIYGGTVDAPCRFVAQYTKGDLYDDDALLAFGKQCDVLTIEVEHISISALRQIESYGTVIYPNADTLALIANKSTQKHFFVQQGIPSAPFWLEDADTIPYPAIAKTYIGGYDGNGVCTVNNWQQAQQAFDSRAFFIEKKLDIKQEISVLLARSKTGEVALYPLIDMQFADGKHVLEYFSSPAAVDASIVRQAQEIAQTIVESLDYVGVMAVEYIVSSNNTLYVNEIAPRVHNSGHHTQFAAFSSQFTQHWRAILGLPLGSTHLHKPVVAMNLLAADAVPLDFMRVHFACADSLTHVHLYHKPTAKAYRKMGHIAALGDTLDEAKVRLNQAYKTLTIDK